MKNIVTTPASRFDNLPDYNFKENYIEVEEDLKLHYLDEGAKKDSIVLLLHGEPSWSYLYRKMIPVLCKNKLRSIAPDLIGFGKSDKWVDQGQYSYQKHIDWLEIFIKSMNLQDITLFCQDWGGLIGLRLVAKMPERFSRIIASNTFLPTGQGAAPEAFLQWREFSQKSPDFNIGKVIEMGTVQELSKEVIEAYNAPFPSEKYKAGARAFPMLVPIEEVDQEAVNNKKAWNIFKEWNKPFLTLFGDKDYITGGMEKVFQNIVPGTKGQKHKILNAGHFIQEEKGEEIADLIVEFIEANP